MIKYELTEIAINFATILFSPQKNAKILNLLCNNITIKHKVKNKVTSYRKSELLTLIKSVYIPIAIKYEPKSFKAIRIKGNIIELEATLQKKPYQSRLSIIIEVEENSKKIKQFKTCLVKKLSGLPGGIFAFSLDSDLSLTTLTEGLVKFFNYRNKYDLINNCGGKLTNLLNNEDLELLFSTIEEVRNKDRTFSILVNINISSLTPIKMYLKGQIIKVSEGKEEVLAQLIIKEVLDDDVDFYKEFRIQFIELIQNHHSPIFFKDSKCIYRLINLAYIKELKIKNMHDIISHSDSEFFKEEGKQFIESDCEILDNNEPFWENSNILTIDNNKTYYSTYKIPIYDIDGISGILGFVSNISKDVEYKQKLHMKDVETDYIFTNSDSPYYIKDKHLRFIKVNDRFCTIFHIKEEMILNKTMAELLPPFIVDPSNKFEKKAFSLKKGESIKDSFEFDFDNQPKYYEITLTPLFDENNKIYRLIGKYDDITETVKKEGTRIIKSYNLKLDQGSSQNKLLYLRIDLETGAILYSKKNFKYHNAKYFNDEFIEKNRNHFLYDFEFIKFKEKYSLESLQKNVEYLKHLPYYTLVIGSKVVQVEVNLEYYTNPTTKHKEVVLILNDISKIVQNKELIDFFGKMEFDFIVKLSFLANYATCQYNNKNEFEFQNLKKDHSIKSLISILYKDSISPVPTVTEWKIFVNLLIKEGKNNTYFIETKSDKRKNISIKVLNKEKQTILVACQDFTETTKKDRAIQKQLRNLAQEAQRTDSIKTEFLSRMSHDMRTPLTAIICLSEFGLSESKEAVSINYFNKIKSSSLYLSILLNDVLEIQKIESGEIVLNNQPFYLPDTADHIKTMVNPRAIEKNINFQICPINFDKGPFYVNNDEVRMSEILVNLLNNAIKYTQNGGIITWTFELKHNPLVLHNTISDNGIGISKAFQKKMFHKYSQEQNIFSGAEGGSGLGLSIVKNLVDLVKGTIECKSELNKGTTFIIDLPLNETTKLEFDKQKIKQIDVSLDILTNKHILVCEDTKINTVIIGKILSKYNITIDIAEDGLKGIKMAKMTKYDAILMDIRMPKMNGLEAAKKIRKFDKKIPIIALSANAYKEDIDKSINAGMNAHLSKPIDGEKLYNTIASYL